MCEKFRNVTHCIFDLDGLLLDTEKLYTQTTQNILSRYDKTYTWEVKILLMGMQHMAMCQRIVDIYDLPLTPDEYSKLQYEYNEEIMPSANLMEDTEVIYEDAIRQIAAEYGEDYPTDIRFKLMGTTEQLSAKIAIEELKLPLTSEEFLKKYHDITLARLPNAAMKAGAERLLCHLHSNKIPICLATSSSEKMMVMKTKKHSAIFNLLHHRVCGSSDPEVKNGKPAPDIFLIAANRFPDKPKPCQCLVFEDAPNGVQAAISAGMQVVMVPDERISAEQCKLATCRLKSLNDFRPELFGLPPFCD